MKVEDMSNSEHPEKEVNISVLVAETLGVLVMKIINYGLMLAAMTYNFWIVVVICFSFAISAM